MVTVAVAVSIAVAIAFAVDFPTFDLNQTRMFDVLKLKLLLKMLCWYNGYGGKHRSLTCLVSSKGFGLHATMTLSAAPTLWYCPPPFVGDIR